MASSSLLTKEPSLKSPDSHTLQATALGKRGQFLVRDCPLFSCQPCPIGNPHCPFRRREGRSKGLVSGPHEPNFTVSGKRQVNPPTVRCCRQFQPTHERLTVHPLPLSVATKHSADDANASLGEGRSVLRLQAVYKAANRPLSYWGLDPQRFS